MNSYDEISKMFYAYTKGLKKINNFYIYKSNENDDFGVAIDNIHDVLIDESFTNVRIRNQVLHTSTGNVLDLLMLTTDLVTYKSEFAKFCVNFINEFEEDDSLLKNPHIWWEKWVKLIGNKFSEKSVYDTIAELLTVLKLLEKNNNVEWDGPEGSSIDVQSDNVYYEVKSSVVRYDSEITISSQFQLDDLGYETYLIYYKMEEMDSGVSINQVMKKIYELNKTVHIDLEEKLDKLGYRLNSKIRDKKYFILESRKYKIDEDFPRLTINSFVNNKVPSNIKKIVYTISLDGLNYDKWEV